MQQESRVKKSLLNARVNLIFYFLTLALAFFSRKTFLDCLGAEFIGLTGTLGNILGFLNLAESGVSAAIAVVLYAPLYESNQQKIKEIVSVLGYLYHTIGKITIKYFRNILPIEANKIEKVPKKLKQPLKSFHPFKGVG